MRLPRRLTLLFSLVAMTLTNAWFKAQAHSQINPHDFRSAWSETMFSLAPWGGDFTLTLLPAFRRQASLLSSSPISPIDGMELLRAAITDKLGARYRLNGTGERGYDCSGFVWRVFQEVGVNFERAPTRELWDRFRAATDEESRQFGTLVFFNDLKHVGIVRDAFSFYHASSSQGVVLSSFAGYWDERITGFRRVPLPGEANKFKIGDEGNEVGERAKEINQRPRRVLSPNGRR